MLYHDYTNRGYVNTMYPFDDMPSACARACVRACVRACTKKTDRRHRNKHKVHFNDRKY